MDVTVIEGLFPSQRNDSTPLSTKDLQSGEAMKERLKGTPERRVSIYMDPQEIKAVVIHHA